MSPNGKKLQRINFQFSIFNFQFQIYSVRRTEKLRYVNAVPYIGWDTG